MKVQNRNKKHLIRLLSRSVRCDCCGQSFPLRLPVGAQIHYKIIGG